MKPCKRTRDLVVQELEGELLIYDLENDKAYCLNRTSTLVWNFCDGQRTESEIANILSEGQLPEANEDVVKMAFHQLWKEGLVTCEEDAGSLPVLNRRELARKAGLTAAVVLPLISSLVVPMPAAAQSGACGASAGLSCGCTVKCGTLVFPVRRPPVPAVAFVHLLSQAATAAGTFVGEPAPRVSKRDFLYAEETDPNQKEASVRP